MNRVIFDIETDGLLDTLSKIHCMSIIHLDQGTKAGEPILHIPYVEGADGMGLTWAAKQLFQADLLIGHNIAGFDILALEKVADKKMVWPPLYDTLIASIMMFPNIATISRHIPAKLQNSHSLEAWGHRLNLHKGDYQGGWEHYSNEMGEYCMQDTSVTRKLFEFLIAQDWSQVSLNLEMKLSLILGECRNHGIYFDAAKAGDLYNELVTKRYHLKQKTRTLFKPWYKFDKEFTYKRTGATVSKIVFTEFNPGSRDHIVSRLRYKYNWAPADFTEKGNVKLDDDILASLPYPEAKVLTELMLIQKRIGQLAEGKQAWISSTDYNSRIHGRINQNGCLTGRATHSSPNLAQVPAIRSLYGRECRELFKAPEGKVLVGSDLSGLELRCLAGYLNDSDSGSMIHNILHSTKNVDDIYTIAGNSVQSTRDIGKTLILAMMYGSGNKKLGAIVDPTLPEEKLQKYGADIRVRISDSIEGYEEFTNKAKDLFRSRGRKVKSTETWTDGRDKYEYIGGWVKGIDGRKLYPAFEHSTLNTLIQGAGAVISKQWILEIVDHMSKIGYTHGLEYTLVNWIHDEVLFECDKNVADLLKAECETGAVLAGQAFNFPCPMLAESSIGLTWADVH